MNESHTSHAVPFLRLESIGKNFGSFAALKDVDLDIREGEFVCFLGPSGCGKSTLLRVIAGLERQSAGKVIQSGRDISNARPAERKVGIVVQSYALFPNLNVFENVAYGLRNQRPRNADIAGTVKRLLELVGLGGAETKFPAQLSGGQQQRVALARAIAPSPRLLLLDEPLSALDAQVRLHLRQQIKQLQQRLGLTTILVTHDQEEALTMADRVVVMNGGRIEQIAVPTSLYDQPVTPFVASFVGKMNFLRGDITPTRRLRVGEAEFELPQGAERGTGQRSVTVCFRPEDVRLSRDGNSNGDVFAATISSIEFLGPFWRAMLKVPKLGQDDVVMDLSSNDTRDLALRTGGAIDIRLPASTLRVFTGSEDTALSSVGAN
ncbi:MAG TPA: putative 2-aminoethylphosphonate ABC transporter ATP-binding protein [Burkholderiales bacterium]|nr:putative 2-aminoethylphosphonate ABC transporter ATP-binding protein [Burkholderiales bacterium]